MEAKLQNPEFWNTGSTKREKNFSGLEDSSGRKALAQAGIVWKNLPVEHLQMGVSALRFSRAGNKWSGSFQGEALHLDSPTLDDLAPAHI